jgi:hypothetical protein
MCHGRRSRSPDVPDVPGESADTYARRALAAVEADGLDAERLAMAVEDYRRAIQMDPTGPYTITPPPFVLLPPAGGAGAATRRLCSVWRWQRTGCARSLRAMTGECGCGNWTTGRKPRSCLPSIRGRFGAWR